MKIHGSHQLQPLITVPKKQSCNSTIMLSINHAFQQRENLATTIEIE
jgi:hypothetical protein